MKKLLFAPLFIATVLVSCSKDDDAPEEVPPRDRGEQEIADQEALQNYLDTHFYNYEDFKNPEANFDYNIVLDTIDAENADKTPLSQSANLETKTIERHDVEYTYYVLKIREGAGERPKFSDSTFVAYQGELLNQRIFDASHNPVWFDLTRVIPGFPLALTEFKGASGFEVQPDNTIKWNNDYGIGAVFLPSGLGYFANPTPGSSIPAYSPLVFTLKLYGVNEADHDHDGIPSWREDLNEDRNVANDDTDEDSLPNFADTDDDGDFIPTREEIVINEDGTLTFPDTDGDGIVDYLDADS